MKTRDVSFALLLFSLAFNLTAFADNKDTSSRPDFEYADCHVHLLDFLQNGEFLNSDMKFPGDNYGHQKKGGRFVSLPYGERGRRIEVLLESMNNGNVTNALVSGMPFLKKWSENEPFQRPRYYLDSPSRVKPARDTDVSVGSAIIDYKVKFRNNQEKLKQLDRIHPSLCGFDATDLGAVDLLIKRIKEFPGVWECIGEVMSRHDDLTNLTTGERPRANHPALARVCRFAGESYIPVSIHHNIAPISRNANEVKLPTYLNEFIELIEYCRAGGQGAQESTVFIWCHSGISRRLVVKDLHLWIDAVMKKYSDQLYIDLSWVVLQDYIMPNLDEWVELIKRYPKRFMIGSDVVGTVSNIGKSLKPYDKLLEALPKDIRVGVSKQNFVDLFDKMAKKRKIKGLGGKGIVLPANYGFSEKAHVRPNFRRSNFMEANLKLLNPNDAG